LGSFEKIVQDERFFSMNVNPKKINRSQDGQNNINGGLSYEHQTFVKPIGWFGKNIIKDVLVKMVLNDLPPSFDHFVQLIST
jgi:hypothetical protein